VLTVDEVFADHQVEHLHLTRRVEHPTRGDIDVLRPPLTFSDTPARIRSGPPADGAHTREVLAELGYDAVEIDELHASGAVGSRASRPQEHEG
jgi:crotonobetainyl-CoA:carnitine CoA-transferase CaiB-like acyl-CoA transferase